MAKKKKQLSPAAKDALARFKEELSDELSAAKAKGVPTIGDYMVEQMMKSQEKKM